MARPNKISGGRPKGRKDSKTAPRAIEVAQHRGEALEYRKMGYSFDAIGQAMGVSTPRAHQLVTEGLRTVLLEPAEEVLKLELVRLDDLLVGSWEAAAKGDPQSLQNVMRILERRAKVLGIDAPIKQELSGTDGGPIKVTAIEWTIVDPQPSNTESI